MVPQRGILMMIKIDQVILHLLVTYAASFVTGFFLSVCHFFPVNFFFFLTHRHLIFWMFTL